MGSLVLPSGVPFLRRRQDGTRLLYGSGGAVGPSTPPPDARYDATQIVQADGTAMATWSDVSGNARNASQATGSKQPTFQTTAWPGSKPCVTFDGVDDVFLVMDPFLAGDTRYTVIAVVRTPSNAREGGIFSNGQTSLGGHNFVLEQNSAVWRINQRDGSGADVFASEVSGVTVNQPAILTARYDGANLVLRRDGVQKQTLACVGRLYSETANAIGANVYTGGYLPWQGNIAEVQVWASVVSDAQCLIVEETLGAKWGVTVP